MSQHHSAEEYAAQLEGTLHIKEQEKIIAECEVQCKAILDLVDSDVLGVETEHFIDGSQQTKSTVGLMVKDGVITNMLTGAPAYMSKKFQKNDRIVKIDDTQINEHGDGLTKALLGPDIPGTMVTIVVRRGSQTLPPITLIRACTTELADKRKMFQLFTQTKDLALHVQTLSQDVNAQKIAPTVDETIDLWTKMMEADQRHDDKIVSNVEGMQKQADFAVRQLRLLLEKLHSISKEAMTNMYGIAKQERDMNEQIISEHDQAEKWRIQMLEWKLKYETLFQEHAACEPKYMKLQSEYSALQVQMNSLQVNYNSLQVNFNSLQLELKMAQEKLAATETELKEARLAHMPCADEIRNLNIRIQSLQAEHAPCADIIADLREDCEDLRKEIKEMKMALEEDDEVVTAKVQAKNAEVQRVKLGSAPQRPSGRVKLGAGAPGSLPVPQTNDRQLIGQIEHKEHAATTMGGIQKLKMELARVTQELEDLKRKHAPCGPTITSLQQQISSLNLEIKMLTDIKIKYEGLVKAHANCPNEIRIITMELTTVRNQLALLQRQHSPCEGLIASLRLQIEQLTHQVHHKNNLCGVGLKISQFNPQELAQGGNKTLVGAHGEATVNDHGGKVWVSRVIPGGPADVNGLIKVDDQILKIDKQEVNSVFVAAGLLRGSPDTTVELLLKAPNGNTYTVNLVRQISRSSEQALRYLDKTMQVSEASPYKELPVLSSAYNSQSSMFASGEASIYGSRRAINAAMYQSGGGAMYQSGGGALYQSGGQELYASGEMAGGMSNGMSMSMISPRNGGSHGMSRIPRAFRTGHVCSCKECGSMLREGVVGA